jgi:hypothetical protein
VLEIHAICISIPDDNNLPARQRLGHRTSCLQALYKPVVCQAFRKKGVFNEFGTKSVQEALFVHNQQV